MQMQHDKYSGKFVLRLSGGMHRQLSGIAKKDGKSLNQVCLDLINAGLAGPAEESGLVSSLRGVVKKIRDHFGGALVGVILFGSHATNTATSSSDIDLLIVVDNGIAIERPLYRWWDDNIAREGASQPSPHFVNLPRKAKDAGGLWIEVATSGKIIYQTGMPFDKLFAEIKECISAGRVKMHISNGHPYWVWRKDNHEK